MDGVSPWYRAHFARYVCTYCAANGQCTQYRKTHPESSRQLHKNAETSIHVVHIRMAALCSLFSAVALSRQRCAEGEVITDQRNAHRVRVPRNTMTILYTLHIPNIRHGASSSKCGGDRKGSLGIGEPLPNSAHKLLYRHANPQAWQHKTAKNGDGH